MGAAKDILLRPIPSAEADALVRRVHYSGKTVNNSQLHIGVFYQGKLEGAMQFGPSLDKRKIMGLVEGTGWNEFIELNRMAFTDALPRNSESRALSIAMRLIKKHAPHIKWVVTFADGTQCGDGTIYRAAGFVLTGIKANDQIWVAPEADARETSVSLTDNRSHREQARAQALCNRDSVTKGKAITHAVAARRGYGVGGGLNLQAKPRTEHSASLRPDTGAQGHATTTGGGSSMRAYIEAGWKPLPGFQLRYLYFIDPTARERLTVPILPFSEIERRGAAMYRGQRPTRGTGETDSAPGSNQETGGASPTVPLLSFDNVTGST